MTDFHSRDAEEAEHKSILMKIHSELCELRGREKKFKSEHNRKIGLNEINYLQQLNFAKEDFFSRPAPLR